MADEERVEEVTPSPAEETVVETTERPAHEIVQDDKDRNRSDIAKELKKNFEAAKREPSPARQEAARKRTREQPTGKFLPEKDKGTEAPIESTAQVEALVASPEAAPVSETAKPAEVPAAPTPAVAPPSSWSQEAKDAWATLPPAVQQAAVKREQEVSAGFAQYQTRYQDIDQAFGPQRDAQLQQLGKTRGQAVQQLFSWHDALANPQTRVQAFAALAQSHGIDLANLAQASSQAQNIDPNDPRLYLQQLLTPLYQEIYGLKGEQLRAVHAKTQQELSEFAKDKPHFEAVRARMAELFEGARVTGRQITLQEAYDAAVWGSGDLRQTLLAEQEAKRQADAKAAEQAAQAKAAEAEAKRRKEEKEAAEKARRANVSPRASTPMGSAGTKPAAGRTSIRDDILSAVKESRAST